ncbi:MAG: nucleoside triphosphate pyrophosphohydrolase [Kiritimatiellae bacterium]|nr:nucleoside triphosphate pyrophosphohydrolase [Kiritimatiellia bacterium]MCO5060987.1 nucleoside triphosphate pyrophosphohydrolase [Kiritimatiellia bacterium]MCO6401830.1 nucleoside triphosphate pyrophosphohydrolase [Verrucomicrobiota bacterium]
MSDTSPSPQTGGHPPPEGPPVQRLLKIMAILRGPGGCPWDHKQTFISLKEHLIEESHEVLDAIDDGDRSKLCDELGDLLLQIVFQSQIATEEGSFTFDDVARTIGDKLVRRHPHVFGAVKADSAEEVLKNWEAIKKTERGDKPRGTLEGIPRSLPALHRAHLIQKRAARVGFDWDNVEGAVAKLEEEVAEIREALAGGNMAEIREEIGDLLFAAVNVSRFLDQNPEELLEQTIRKFTRRFDDLEKIVRSRGKNVADLPLADLDLVWEEVKRGERGAQ